MLLAVVALALLLAADESFVHTKEALSLAKASIMRSPEFVVRAIRTWVVSSLALRLVKLRKIYVDKEGLVGLLNSDLFINLHVNFVVVIEATHMLGIGSIDHELL